MTLIAPNQNNPIHLQSNFGMGSDFGHADYVQAVNAGATLAEIRDWATRNPNQFIGENAVGAGGLYDKIMSSSTPRGARPGIDNNPSNTAAGNWIGNSNTFDPYAKNYSIYRDIDVPEVNIPHPNDPYIPSGGYSGNPADQSYHPMSSEFIKQTYDPKLGYERPENPYSLLNDYIFRIKDELKNQDELELKVGTITPQDTDLVRRDDELNGPYTQYSSEHY